MRVESNRIHQPVGETKKHGPQSSTPATPACKESENTPNVLAQAEEPNSNEILRLSPQPLLFNKPLTISINEGVATILGIQMNEDGYLIITNKEDAKFTIQRTINRLKKRSFDSDDGFPELMLRIVFEDELQGKDLQAPEYQQCRNKVTNPENPSEWIPDIFARSRFIENLKTSPDEFVPQALDASSFGLHFNRAFHNSSDEEALNMFVNYTNTLINIKLNNPQEFTKNETNNKSRETQKQKEARSDIPESPSVRKAWDEWLQR
jgi:hypothetical protein